MRRSLLVLLAISASSVACARPGAEAPDGVFFPTVRRLDGYPAAALSGRLAEQGGCLQAGGRHGLVLLWPDGYTASIGQSGRIQVLDEDGDLIATVGQEMNLGGGIVTGSFDTTVYWHTPAGCSHRYWLVAPS
jgi:hypothetical protein